MNLKAGYPFSLINSGLFAEYPKLGKNITTDVVILGGGISGALTAWHLLKQHVDTVVLDARSIGLGSTCASTSLLQYEIDVSLHELSKMIGMKNASLAYHRCKDAIDKLEAIAGEIGFKGVDRKKSLYYAAKKKDQSFLEEEFLARKSEGFDVEYLHELELWERTGIVASGAILSADGAQTDAYLFTHHLHQSGIKKGLQVYDRTTAASIIHHKTGVTIHTNEGCIIKAKKLVYATGYEAVNFVDQPIVRLLSTYATISEPLPPEKKYPHTDLLIWNTDDPYLYIRAYGDRVLVGGRDEKFYSPSKRDKLIPSKTKKLAGDFKKIFPDTDFNTEFSWTGTFGSTKDGLPFIGPYKKLPNSYFALGFGGNGITFSLIAAEIIADLLKGKKDPDMAIYSFDRI